jgi:CoA:oxalate CoA-transferase
MSSATESPTGYPLAGLKVLDFSRVLSGPYAGRLLSDLGAEVVKVEPPDGDITRSWGRVIGGIPGYYHNQNAGKRNISMDLRAPGARELVFELVKHADVLIENYRPDVMGRLGLGWETLHEVNPRLVMLSITGFGHGGPESDRPAYAPIVHAEVGLMERGSRRLGGRRADLPLSVADTNASLHGLVGLLSALLMRARTGVGQHVDIAMVDATVSADDQLHYDLEGASGSAPLPNDTWETGAGPILVSADFRFVWRRLTERVGIEEPDTKDADLATKIALRRETVGRFMQGLTTWDAVKDAFDKMNIAWGEVRPAKALRDQPTLRHRGAIADVDDRAGGVRPTNQSPYRFSEAKSGVRGGAPHRGEHNAEVLHDWLGLSAAQVAGLEADGVLGRDAETLGGAVSGA